MSSTGNRRTGPRRNGNFNPPFPPDPDSSVRPVHLVGREVPVLWRRSLQGRSVQRFPVSFPCATPLDPWKREILRDVCPGFPLRGLFRVFTYLRFGRSDPLSHPRDLLKRRRVCPSAWTPCPSPVSVWSTSEFLYPCLVYALQRWPLSRLELGLWWDVYP